MRAYVVGLSVSLSLFPFFFFFPQKHLGRYGCRDSAGGEKEKKEPPPFQSTFNPVCVKEITAQQPNQQATPHAWCLSSFHPVPHRSGLSSPRSSKTPTKRNIIHSSSTATLRSAFLSSVVN
uniref:Uncharacterized protein n=1 Tax=Coccidioides posadasii RMSCC 3488 TaxID=454284 RepID=A0A0J6F8M4_COCPO|nr:hypothetical protein CPAG_01946 [Coccidioides posadasii RMSCC 3488]